MEQNHTLKNVSFSYRNKECNRIGTEKIKSIKIPNIKMMQKCQVVEADTLLCTMSVNKYLLCIFVPDTKPGTASQQWE